MRIGVAQVEFDGERGARRMGDARGAFDVAHAPERIARRFEPDEPGRSRPHHPFERRQILGLDEIDAEAEGRRFAHEPGAQRPVHALGRDHMSSRSKAQEKRDRRRHAGAIDERRRGALERPDHRLRLAHGLVVGTAIDVAAAIEIVGVALEGGRDMDRRHDGAGALIDTAQGLGGEGART